MTREQLQRFVEDLHHAYYEAKIETARDYDPDEDYYFAGWKMLDPEQRRFWWRMAEKLVGTVKPAPETTTPNSEVQDG